MALSLLPVAASLASCGSTIPKAHGRAPGSMFAGDVSMRLPPPSVAPPQVLTDALTRIQRGFEGHVGIAVTRIDGVTWTTGANLAQYFPQQSVSKLWVALTILDKVDHHELSLDQPVRITTADLAVFNQPIRAEVMHNGGVIDDPVHSLLEDALRMSDNTANDSLLRTAGGPMAVRAFLASKGIAGIRFGPGERLLQARTAGLTWNQSLALGRNFYVARDRLPMAVRHEALDSYLADPIDGAAPDAITRTLARLARGELLSPVSTDRVLSILARTHSGPNRLKGGVPPGWSIMHKTGTGQELTGTATGYNDVGILVAPDGTRYAIAVMIGMTRRSIPERMAMMHDVVHAVVALHDSGMDRIG